MKLKEQPRTGCVLVLVTFWGSGQVDLFPLRCELTFIPLQLKKRVNSIFILFFLVFSLNVFLVLPPKVSVTTVENLSASHFWLFSHNPGYTVVISRSCAVWTDLHVNNKTPQGNS